MEKLECSTEVQYLPTWIGVPACGMLVWALLLAALHCEGGRSMGLRLNLPGKAISKISLRHDATIKDFYDLLRHMNVVNESETIRVGEKALDPADTQLCRDCLEPDAMISLSPATNTPSHDAILASENGRSNSATYQFLIPSSSARVLHRVASGKATAAVSVGKHTPQGPIRVLMQFELGSSPKDGPINSSYVSQFLEELKTVHLVASALQCGVLGLVFRGPPTSRDLLLTLLAGTFLGTTEVHMLSACCDRAPRKSGRGRVLARRFSETEEDLNRETVLTIETKMISNDIWRLFEDGSIPNYVMSPDNFLAAINSNEPRIKLLNRINMSGRMTSYLAPSEILSLVSSSKEDIGYTHEFPSPSELVENDEMQVVKKLIGKIDACYGSKEGIVSLLRDPHLLLFIQSHILKNDTSSFFRLCDFVSNHVDSPAANRDRLAQSEFLVMVDWLKSLLWNRVLP